MPSAARGFPSSTGRGAPGQMSAVNGEMMFGRILARNVELRSSFKEWARTPGALSGERDLHVVFTIGCRRVIVFEAIKFSLRVSGSRIPCSRPVGTRQITSFLAPTRRTFWLGR